MANNILQASYLLSGEAANLYLQIWRGDAQVWSVSGAAFEAYNASNYANYDIAVTEIGSTGIYTATFPAAISEGWYTVRMFYTDQSAGTPTEGDLKVAEGDEYWDGTDILGHRQDVSGSGARTVTVTVDDGSTALENASVRFSKGALTYLQATDASGNATFNLDDGTWTVAITLAGYTFSGTTLVVDGDETPTYSMSAQTITAPADVSLCTVQFRVKLGNTAVLGAVCTARLQGINEASDGTVLSNADVSDTTDASGIAELQLVRKDSIVKGTGVYEIEVKINGNPVANIHTAIPNQDTILFEDLL